MNSHPLIVCLVAIAVLAAAHGAAAQNKPAAPNASRATATDPTAPAVVAKPA